MIGYGWGETRNRGHCGGIVMGFPFWKQLDQFREVRKMMKPVITVLVILI